MKICVKVLYYFGHWMNKVTGLASGRLDLCPLLILIYNIAKCYVVSCCFVCFYFLVFTSLSFLLFLVFVWVWWGWGRGSGRGGVLNTLGAVFIVTHWNISKF